MAEIDYRALLKKYMRYIANLAIHRTSDTWEPPGLFTVEEAAALQALRQELAEEISAAVRKALLAHQEW